MEAQPPTPSAKDPRRSPSAQDAEAEHAARLLAEALSSPTSETPGVRAPTLEEIAASFPKLEILGVLGQGGMGVVYKARQTRLDRLVALKILYRELASDPAFPERFEREAQALARLDHRHIVRVHDFGETDGLYWLLLEYVDGASLRQLMSTDAMSSGEALGIVPQICDALQYAHDQGVVHRDIKPENVLIDTAGQVHIADFGLAKLVGAGSPANTLTGTHQVMGTWQYMAPEQYRAPQDVDHRADIFSLGVVFYEMLTGDLPVGRYRQPSEMRNLDQRIDAIVMRTLERERDQRYQHALDVRTDVEAVEATADRSVAESTRAAQPDPAAPPLAEPNHRRWRLGHARSPKARWLLALSTLTLPLGIVIQRRLYETAAAGPFEEAATWWTRGQVVTTVLWGVGILLAVAAIRHATSTAWRLAPLLIILVQLAFVGLVLVGGRQANWGSFLTSQSIAYEEAYEEKREGWLVDVRSRYTAGAPLPTVELMGGGTLLEGWVDQAMLGILETWQRFAYRNGPTPFSVRDAPGFYPPTAIQALEQMGTSERGREQASLQLGLPFVDEAGLETPYRDLYVRHIRLAPDYRHAVVELAPRAAGNPLVVRFPMLRGTAPDDWLFARGPVSVLEVPVTDASVERED